MNSEWKVKSFFPLRARINGIIIIYLIKCITAKQNGTFRRQLNLQGLFCCRLITWLVKHTTQVESGVVSLIFRFCRVATDFWLPDRHRPIACHRFIQIWRFLLFQLFMSTTQQQFDKFLSQKKADFANGTVSPFFMFRESCVTWHS